MIVVADFVINHEQTQLNRVCFSYLVYSSLPKDLHIQILFIFTAAGAVRLMAVKCLHVYHISAYFIFLYFGVIGDH